MKNGAVALAKIRLSYATDEKLAAADGLDVERTTLANERTLLAYVRTALTMFVVGGTFIHFFSIPAVRALGLAFIVIAAFTVAMGFWRFEKVKSAIRLMEQHNLRAPDED